MRPAAESVVNTLGPIGSLPPPGPSLAIRDRALEHRELGAQLRRGGLAPARERLHDPLGRLRQPALAVREEARLLHVAAHAAPFGGGNAGAGARLGERQNVAREDEQRAPHREVLHERALVVERAVHIRDAHAVHARPRGQVHAGRIRPMKADEARGGLDHVARPMSGRQPMAAGEATPAFGGIDPLH